MESTDPNRQPSDPAENQAQPAPENPVETPLETPAESPTAETAEPAADETLPAPVLEPPAPVEPAEPRMRRFFRAALRWLVLALTLFAAGILAAYFILYQPLRRQADAAQVQLAQANQDLSTTRQELQAAKEQAINSQSAADSARAELTKAQNRAYLQMTLTDIANARLALVNKDGANARLALLAARTDLEQLMPAIQAKDAEMGEALAGRLALAINELSRDPRTAQADLEVLTRNLQDLEKVLFQ